MRTGEKGIYFLANDAILEWVIAFLNSVRMYDPGIPLCLIPFNERVEGVLRLRRKYDFMVYDDPKRLKHLDEIGGKFYDGTPIRQFQDKEVWSSAYRKLAVWDGPFEKFIFMDPDIVILESLDFLYDHLERFDFIFGRKDNLQFVWNTRMDLSNAGLAAAQLEHTFNMGFLISRRNALDRAFMDALIPEALGLKKYFAPVPEQPLTHFFVYRSNKPFCSIYDILHGYTHEIIREYEHLCVKGRKAFLPDGRKLLLAHWAGSEVPTLHDVLSGRLIHSELWRAYRYTDLFQRYYIGSMAAIMKCIKSVTAQRIIYYIKHPLSVPGMIKRKIKSALSSIKPKGINR